MRREETVGLVWFGLPGHVLECQPKKEPGCTISGHLSGYHDPDSFVEAVRRGRYAGAEPYETRYVFPEGTPVLDKRPALRGPHGVNLSFRSPLLNLALADQEIERCPEPSEALAAGVSGAFVTYLACQTAHRASGAKTPGPLDSISCAAYVAYWRAAGARVGRLREGGTVIEWEGGAA